MRLFIRIVDGVPFEHPIIEPNFKEAFPDVNLESLPPEYGRFIRVPAPALGPYEKNQTVSYELVDGQTQTWTDVWSAEEMTQEEKTAKQDQVKAAWAEGEAYASWTFNEDLCAYVPPVEMPADGNMYTWDEENQQWVMMES